MQPVRERFHCVEQGPRLWAKSDPNGGTPGKRYSGPGIDLRGVLHGNPDNHAEFLQNDVVSGLAQQGGIGHSSTQRAPCLGEKPGYAESS